jgi:hypothetical protein
MHPRTPCLAIRRKHMPPAMSAIPERHEMRTPKPNSKYSVRRVRVAIAVLAAVTAGASTASATTVHYALSHCVISVRSPGSKRMALVHEFKWDTDSWIRHPPAVIGPDSDADWSSQGGLFRGCHNGVKYDLLHAYGSDRRPLAQVEISETLPWHGSPSFHCRLAPVAGRSITPGSRCVEVWSFVKPKHLGARLLDVSWKVHYQD